MRPHASDAPRRVQLPQQQKYNKYPAHPSSLHICDIPGGQTPSASAFPLSGNRGGETFANPRASRDSPVRPEPNAASHSNRAHEDLVRKARQVIATRGRPGTTTPLPNSHTRYAGTVQGFTQCTAPCTSGKASPDVLLQFHPPVLECCLRQSTTCTWVVRRCSDTVQQMAEVVGSAVSWKKMVFERVNGCMCERTFFFWFKMCAFICARTWM